MTPANKKRRPVEGGAPNDLLGSGIVRKTTPRSVDVSTLLSAAASRLAGPWSLTDFERVADAAPGRQLTRHDQAVLGLQFGEHVARDVLAGTLEARRDHGGQWYFRTAAWRSMRADEATDTVLSVLNQIYGFGEAA